MPNSPIHHPLSRPRLDAAIDSALAEERLVGAVAGLPMQQDALSRLASVSEPIVTTAAMVLVERGRFGLDDEVQRWLPEFRPRLLDGQETQISVRQLMTHTAGLGYRFLEADVNGPSARTGVSDGIDRVGLSLAENLRRLATVPLLYTPGTDWGYSLGIDGLGGVSSISAPTASSGL